MKKLISSFIFKVLYYMGRKSATCLLQEYIWEKKTEEIILLKIHQPLNNSFHFHGIFSLISLSTQRMNSRPFRTV